MRRREVIKRRRSVAFISWVMSTMAQRRCSNLPSTSVSHQLGHAQINTTLYLFNILFSFWFCTITIQFQISTTYYGIRITTSVFIHAHLSRKTLPRYPSALLLPLPPCLLATRARLCPRPRTPCHKPAASTSTAPAAPMDAAPPTMAARVQSLRGRNGV